MKYKRMILWVPLIFVFICGVFAMILLQDQYATGKETYDEALQLADGTIAPAQTTAPQTDTTAATQTVPQTTAPETVPEPTEPPPIEDENAEFLLGLDLQSLQDVNPEVLGWIYLPGTAISYPLLQHEDNGYYTDHTWDGQHNYTGAIFMESLNSPNFHDFNTILYGHNLKNGEMFTDLDKYRVDGYLEDHPYVYIVDDRGSFRYQIFAAYEVSVTDAAYTLGLRTETGKQNYIDECLRKSQIDTDVVLTASDFILTLSTCTVIDSNTRWIVQAKLDGPICIPESE